VAEAQYSFKNQLARNQPHVRLDPKSNHLAARLATVKCISRVFRHLGVNLTLSDIVTSPL
jgi:hypothetical protein